MSVAPRLIKVIEPSSRPPRKSAAEIERERWGGKVPSKSTLKALKELENGGGHSFGSLDELWADLES